MVSNAYNSFFVIESDPVGSEHETDAVTSSDAVFGDAPRCQYCGSFIGLKPWLPPYKIELILYGTDWGDFAVFSSDYMIVARRVAESLVDYGLTGLSGFDSVKLVKVKGSKKAGSPPDYKRVSVARSGAAIDESRSSITRFGKVRCDYCRSNGIDAIHGFEIENGSWTGEDVFVARGLPGHILATERFVDVLTKEAFTNVRAIPTQDYEWDAFGPFQHV